MDDRVANADQRLDVTGTLCPEPVLKARAALAGLEPGQVLEILTDDPLAELDLRILCERTVHEWLGCEARDGVLRTRIRCGSDGTPPTKRPTD